MPRSFAACLAALVAALGSENSEAATLVDSKGFEAPTFVNGPLAGQDNWGEIFLGSTSTAAIQSGTVQSGSSALRVNRQGQSDGFWAKDLPSDPTGRFVSIDWDMLVESTGSFTAFGPLFGVEVINDRGMNQIDQLGTFGVDASTGEVLYEDQTGAILVGPPVTLGVWNHFRIELDFGNQSYRAFVGEQLVAQSPFNDATSTFTNADIIARAAAADLESGNIGGVAYFDNYIVRDGLRGDYNNDGLIDAADYTVWRDQLNQSGTGLAADGNADGVVDSTDYQLWRSSYGISNSLATSTLSIPEPAGALLLLIGLSLAAPSSRRTI